MGGISCASTLFTRTVALNRLLFVASSTSPTESASETPNHAAGSACAPTSGGKLSPVSEPSPRTRTVNSIGSPTETTLRDASTAMEKPRPMALTKLSGRPLWGRARTVKRRASSSARKTR